MTRRSAHTLIELAVSMSVGSTFLILAVGLVHQAMDLSSISRQRVRVNRDVNRLVTQFRRDIHLARNVSASPEGLSLEIPGSNGVAYTINEMTVTRVEAIDPDKSWREIFVLGKEHVVGFALMDQECHAILTIHRSTPLSVPDRILKRHVEVTVGRILQSQRQKGATK